MSDRQSALGELTGVLERSWRSPRREPLVLVPLAFRDLVAFVKTHHRHNLSPRGWKFGIAVSCSGSIAGVVSVGRPVARALQDGRTLEVTRLCTDGTPNACSKLYAAAAAAAFAMGYTRLVTYTLASESGVSLRAAGWVAACALPARDGNWNAPSRVRRDTGPTEAKVRWERRSGRLA